MAAPHGTHWEWPEARSQAEAAWRVSDRWVQATSGMAIMADTPLVRRASRVLDAFDFLAETGEVWDSVQGQGRRAAGAGRPAKTEGNHELMREIRPFIDARPVLIG